MRLLHNRWLHPTVNFPTQGQQVRHDVTQPVRRTASGRRMKSSGLYSSEALFVAAVKR